MECNFLYILFHDHSTEYKPVDLGAHTYLSIRMSDWMYTLLLQDVK
jgi:hypothetical protein